MTNKYIAYRRVSTPGQSFESQRAMMEKAVGLEGAEVIESFEEVATGSLDNMPILNQAIAAARHHGCPIMVAHFDRLTRNEKEFKRLMEQVIVVSAAEAVN